MPRLLLDVLAAIAVFVAVAALCIAFDEIVAVAAVAFLAAIAALYAVLAA